MNDQGLVYSDFLQSELDRESKRRESIDSRAMTTVTSSGAIVTLTLGVIAAWKAGGGRAPLDAVPLLLAAGSFLTAALLAVVAGFTWNYDVASTATLRRMFGKHWTDSEVTARNGCARLRLASLTTLRHGNNTKAWVLTCAQGSQCLGILLLLLTLVQAFS